MDDSNRIRIIRDWINGDYSQNTSDDELFRNKVTKEITERDIEYTQLLSHFVYITKIRNCLKEFFKWVFLIVIISSIVFFAFKLNSVFDFFNKEDSLSSSALNSTDLSDETFEAIKNHIKQEKSKN